MIAPYTDTGHSAGCCSCSAHAANQTTAERNETQAGVGNGHEHAV